MTAATNIARRRGQGQFPNVLHRRAQTVGSQSLEGRDGNASLSICVNAELANES
jgi:hypothetical protein